MHHSHDTGKRKNKHAQNVARESELPCITKQVQYLQVALTHTGASGQGLKAARRDTFRVSARRVDVGHVAVALAVTAMRGGVGESF